MQVLQGGCRQRLGFCDAKRPILAATAVLDSALYLQKSTQQTVIQQGRHHTERVDKKVFMILVQVSAYSNK